MASGPITAWQIEGENVEEVTEFLFLDSKITADSDCSHEIRLLLLGRKAMTNLDSVLKSKDITLLTKIHIVKAMVPPGVTYGCESWTVITEGQARKNWCLQTAVLEKTPESPSNSKEIKPVKSWGKSTRNTCWKAWCWSWNSSTLVMWWEQPTHWKSPWCWERLRAEGEEGIRGWVSWMASPIQWTWAWANFGKLWGTERLPAAVHGVAKSQTPLGDWTTTAPHIHPSHTAGAQQPPLCCSSLSEDSNSLA